MKKNFKNFILLTLFISIGGASLTVLLEYLFGTSATFAFCVIFIIVVSLFILVKQLIETRSIAKYLKNHYILTAKIHPCMGLAVGFDTQTYSNKIRRNYMLIILCFVIQLDVSKNKKVKDEKA